jgi:hypothetical protein
MTRPSACRRMRSTRRRRRLRPQRAALTIGKLVISASSPLAPTRAGDGVESDTVILAPRPGSSIGSTPLSPIAILGDPPRTEIQDRCPDGLHLRADGLRKAGAGRGVSDGERRGGPTPWGCGIAAPLLSCAHGAPQNSRRVSSMSRRGVTRPNNIYVMPYALPATLRPRRRRASNLADRIRLRHSEHM